MLVSGIEPNLRWRTFADAVLDAAERLGVEMVVTLGALLADVAHTRPVPITGLASDPELVERLGLSRSSYEGPTGIVGIVHDACRRRGMTSASLWAAVPHYVAAVPNPKAALALLRRLEGFTGIAIEASELEDAMEPFETQVDRAVASNPEIEELVRRLEAEQDDEPIRGGRQCPRATRSPATSSASCASAASPRTSRASPHRGDRDRHQVRRKRPQYAVVAELAVVARQPERRRARRRKGGGQGQVDLPTAVVEASPRCFVGGGLAARPASVKIPQSNAGCIVTVGEDPDLARRRSRCRRRGCR